MTITKRIELGTLAGSFSWAALRGFVDDINAREPAMQERITCQIIADKLFASVTRDLTPAEEVLHVRAEVEAQAETLRKLLTNEFGRGLTPERADELRRLLGLLPGHPSGTQAPAAGPATPNTPPPPAPPPSDDERRAQFRTAAAMGGWKLPDQASEALKYARQMGMADLAAADVERWEALPPGSLGG
jgi:hypothetical protein